MISLTEVERAARAPFWTSGTRDQCAVTWLLCIDRQTENIFCPRQCQSAAEMLIPGQFTQLPYTVHYLPQQGM